MYTSIAATALAALFASEAAALNPIIVKGSHLYDSGTKERFFVKGLTYEYAVDDKYYVDNKQFDIFKTKIQPLGVNTLRLYNINPDLSYDKFMADMKTLGIYVMPAASPGGDDYFADYKFCALNRFGTPGFTSNTCYPTCLLQYGQKIASKFAKYDNTLAIIIGNEVMQYNATSAPCVKQYASDLKAWMGTPSGVKAMRTVPIAYAEADTAPASAFKVDPAASSDDWATLRNQFFVCDDKTIGATTKSSIDISMTNIYRWCDAQTGPTGYDNIRKAVMGFPGVNLFGELDCVPKTGREWSNLNYLYSTKMTDVYSGGFIYTWGAAGISQDQIERGFPLVTDSSAKVTGSPGSKTGAAYDSLLKALPLITVPKQTGTWSSAKDMCSTAGPVQTGTNSFTQTCSSLVSKMSTQTATTVTWPIETRQNAICGDNGVTCPVSYPSGYSTTQNSLCGGSAPTLSPEGGNSDSASGGGSGNSTSGGSSSKSDAPVLASSTASVIVISALAAIAQML